MASGKRSLSESRDGPAVTQPTPTFVDDARYRQGVLQLEPDQTEDSMNAALVDEARQLGLVSWDAHAHPERPFSDFFFESTTGTRTPPPPTSSSTSARQPSTANTSTIQIPDSAACASATSPINNNNNIARDPAVPTSPHSSVVSSSSTCPPPCTGTVNHESQLPLTSHRTETHSRHNNNNNNNNHHHRNRYSLDPRRVSTISNSSFYSSISSSRRPGSSDSRLRSGLRHAFLHFSSFKRRTSVDNTACSPASTCSECQQPARPNVQDHDEGQVPEDREARRNWIDPVKHPVGSADEDAVFRSLACPALLSMRSSQDDQRTRHLALRRDVVEHMAAVHRDRLENQKSQNQKAEQELADRNSERIAVAEERHLSAELALWEEFRLEKLALQNGIRHMEEYFKTPNPVANDDSGGDSSTLDSAQPLRQYTQQHRDRLRQKYHERDSIDTLHESKIKVLRDRQAKQSEEAARKMDREATELAESNGQRYRDLEKRCQDEEAATLDWLRAREKQLAARWTLEEAIMRKKLELETNVTYGPLPALSFDSSQV